MPSGLKPMPASVDHEHDVRLDLEVQDLEGIDPLDGVAARPPRSPASRADRARARPTGERTRATGGPGGRRTARIGRSVASVAIGRVPRLLRWWPRRGRGPPPRMPFRLSPVIGSQGLEVRALRPAADLAAARAARRVQRRGGGSPRTCERLGSAGSCARSDVACRSVYGSAPLGGEDEVVSLPAGASEKLPSLLSRVSRRTQMRGGAVQGRDARLRV